MYISPYCRQARIPPTFVKFSIRDQLIDIIKCVKLLVNRFWGYGVPTSHNCPFPLTCCVALTIKWIILDLAVEFIRQSGFCNEGSVLKLDLSRILMTFLTHPVYLWPLQPVHQCFVQCSSTRWKKENRYAAHLSLVSSLSFLRPRAGSGVVRIDSLRFLEDIVSISIVSISIYLSLSIVFTAWRYA